MNDYDFCYNMFIKFCMYVGYHDAKMCQILVVTQ